MAKFIKLVASGVDPEAIIAGARAYADEQERLGKVNTQYVATSIAWLNQRRWEDYAHAEPAAAFDWVFVRVDSPQWTAWQAKKRTMQMDFKVNGHYQRGWYFKSEWPQ